MDPKLKAKLAGVLKQRQDEITALYAAENYRAATVATQKLAYWLNAVADQEVETRHLNDAATILLEQWKPAA